MLQVLLALITSAAVAHGVNPAQLRGMALCESTFNQFAQGGGLYQLRSPGELDRFYARGYDNVYDPAQQSNFVAERLSEHVESPWPYCRYVRY